MGRPDCCEGLTYFTYNSTTSTSHHYTAEDDTSTTDEDAKSSCGTMVCFGELCKPCTVQDDVCGLSQPDCCEDLTCFTYNSTTSTTCQNCTAENDTCTTDEDAKSCCGTLTCFGGHCKPCTVRDDVCGLGQPGCCEGLTCFTENSTTSTTCQNCTTKDSTCGDKIPGCCSGLTCFNDTCQNCTTENGTCGDSSPPCCGSMKCDNTTCVKPNGALSLFNMHFSLKQLVGFVVVMVATGIL